jgi:lantibiotic modifying enzyme
MEFYTQNNKVDILNLFSDEIDTGSSELFRCLNFQLEPLSVDRGTMIELLLPNLENSLHKISECTLLAHYLASETKIPAINVATKIDFFCKLLHEEDVRDYFKSSFPVLYDFINTETRQWINHSLNISDRYLNDHEKIWQKFFNGINPGFISKIELGLGDKHCNGESVSMLHFKNGKKLIYVPRKRNLHSHFYQLCDWLEKLINIGFKHPETLIMETHTWVEFIENESCTDIKQIKRFYERTGVYLALLYVMDATDFHYENIVASAEYPVLIDLESFFHPFMPFEMKENHIGICNSVLKTGLLPVIHSFDGEDCLDASGLSNVKGSIEINKSLQFILDENGKITTQRKKGRLTGAKNVPLLFDKPVEISNIYSQDLKRGFQNSYEIIKTNKKEFLEQLDCFKKDEIRVIFRNTAVYSHLLTEGKHPDLLRNIDNTLQHLNWLNYIHKEYPISNIFTSAEKDDLMNLTIPYFHTIADSTDLWHNGKILKNDFFNKSGYETAKEKISILSDDDLERQCWIIDMSLAIKEMENKPYKQPIRKKPSFLFENHTYGQIAKLDLHAASRNTPSIPSMNDSVLFANPVAERRGMLSPEFDRKIFLEASLTLAEELTKNMKITEKEAYWLVFKPIDFESHYFEIAPASYDLYSGMPGEIISLSYLGMISGQNKYSEIAYKALHYLIMKVENSIYSIKNTGIFGGLGSLVYLMAILTKIKGNNVWTDLALTWIKRINPYELSINEMNHGLVNGTAGFIISCLAAFKASKENEFLFIAEKLSGILLRCALKSENQLKWKGYSKRPLVGLSHGSSGYALCFAMLYHHTGNNRYKDIVKKILNYETYLYEPKQKNWPDLRDFVIEQNRGNTYFSTAWSHGAPGIGLARIEIMKLGIKNEKIVKDLEASIETCIKYGFGNGHNLCYGDFGNLELLINSSIHLNDSKLKDIYRKIASEILQEGMNNGFRLTQAKTYTPGLMNGITGIIYQCMRIYDPETVPSILSLSI